MADWKVIGGITALGGIVGFFGAKTVDSRKLPAGEKAVLTVIKGVRCVATKQTH